MDNRLPPGATGGKESPMMMLMKTLLRHTSLALLKATLFNRRDFAALSRSFVAEHVDGDRPAAAASAQAPNV